jgi:hypothetical protein
MRDFFSKDGEPVRRYVYGVAVALLALLVTLGVVTGEAATAVGGFLAAALLVPTAEIVRSKVSPSSSGE